MNLTTCKTLILFLLVLPINYLYAQKTPVVDTTDLLSQLEQEDASKKTAINYTTATFKTTRLINGHSVENVAKGVLDVKISHRFGTLNGGAYELFGLDNASMRMGFDYGITNAIMVGVGRSTFQKTFDAFVKVKLLRQSTGGKRNMPITLSYVPTIALNSLKWADPTRKNLFSSRLSYTHQLIIGRKFSEGTSLQLMPTFIHRNLAETGEKNDLLAVGIGGRQKLTKRVSINVEYYYQIDGYKLPNSTNSLSIGFDIETGGHVFQLHFTNSRGMFERSFISETTGKWDKGDILFGFNISRVFTIGKR
jgi:hypothetical protein